jgi:hypothetical protein
MDGIAPGKDPDELAIAPGHQHRADVMVAHVVCASMRAMKS